MSAALVDADMFNPTRRSVHCLAALALVVTLAPRASIALQRLEVFAAGARERNPAALEAGANLREKGAEADVALGRVLPGISFVGRYDRNQYSSEIDLGAVGGPNRTIVLLPRNQWTGIATATGSQRQGRGPRPPPANSTRRDWTSRPASRSPTTNSSQASRWSRPRSKRSRCRARRCVWRKNTTARGLQPFWRSTGRAPRWSSAFSRPLPRSCRLPCPAVPWGPLRA